MAVCYPGRLIGRRRIATITVAITTLGMFLCCGYLSLKRPDVLTLTANNDYTNISGNPDQTMWPTANRQQWIKYAEIPRRYLTNYRNPCWYEPMSPGDPYRNNWFRATRRPMFLKYFARAGRKRARGQSRRLRCLPLLYQIGLAKCGTTDLYHTLIQHPLVVEGGYKEPMYWSYHSNKVPFTQYIDLYDTAAMKLQQIMSSSNRTQHPGVTVDGSIMELVSPAWRQVPGNAGLPEPKIIIAHYIKHFVPQAKILLILRDPTERLYSDYCYFNKDRPTLGPAEFHKMTLQEISRMKQCLNNDTIRFCVYNITPITKVRLGLGMYFPFVRDWLEIFPSEQFKVIRLEDYKKDEPGTANKVFHFLDLPPHAVSHTEVKVRGPRHPRMLENTRSLLRDFHKPFNAMLSKLLDDDSFLFGY